jgi:hypothetical protein
MFVVGLILFAFGLSAVDSDDKSVMVCVCVCVCVFILAMFCPMNITFAQISGSVARAIDCWQFRPSMLSNNIPRSVSLANQLSRTAVQGASRRFDCSKFSFFFFSVATFMADGGFLLARRN